MDNIPVGNFWLQKPCIKLTLRPCNVAERFQKWCNWCTRKYFATLQKGCKQVARQCCNILAKRPKCVYVRRPPKGHQKVPIGTFSQRCKTLPFAPKKLLLEPLCELAEGTFQIGCKVSFWQCFALKKYRNIEKISKKY